MSIETEQNVLIVEDATSLGVTYSGYLESEGYTAEHVTDGQSALRCLDQTAHSAIVLDLQLPDMDGLDILRHVATRNLDTAVVVVTGNGSLKVAVEAMRAGAYDFLVKPITRDRLVRKIGNAVQSVGHRKGSGATRPSQEQPLVHGFIGNSIPMQSVYQMIDNVARSAATVFITGESGTGKELCAEAIHASCARRDRPFVALNCGAIPSDLIESEIFGHMRGSFTGAVADRVGAAKQADGGTLFLDEICEMDFSLQTKLLRFLQTGTIQRVGNTEPESVDVRIICATNRDPFEEVRAGRFREDLYYRLHVIPIHLPPLRDRQDDVIEIAEDFLTRYANEEGKSFNHMSPEAKGALRVHDWPGNVRELQNVIRNVVVMNDADELTARMLAHLLVRTSDSDTRAHEAPAFQAASSSAQAYVNSGSFLGKKLWEIEKDVIERTIDACGGSVPKAARVLGISPSTIYRKKESWLEHAQEHVPDKGAA